VNFDWLQFLEQHGITYRQVSRAEVTVTCPFCGHDDPSQHMNINLEGRGWHCWRNDRHGGRDPTRLVAALLHCTMQAAAQLTRSNSFLPTNFLERIQTAMQPRPAPSPQLTLKLPSEFRELDHGVMARPYVHYLLDRGFHRDEIDGLSNHDVYYCPIGPYHGRIMFCVYHRNHLITWTGRTVSDTPGVVRYRTLSPLADKAEQEGSPPALGPLPDYLLWFDELLACDARTIVVCEGPFDALKVLLLGQTAGVVATCLFGNRMSPAQIELLHKLLPRFKRRILLLDRETLPNTLKIQGHFTKLKLEARYLPSDLKDHGELDSQKQLLKIIN